MGPLLLAILWRNGPYSTLYAVVLLLASGFTDALDGYLARKQNRITALGIMLDPLADKLFALCVVIGLLLFRELPFWLFAVIVGRDLIILIGGLYLTSRAKISLPSNLSGKYAFAATAVYLGCYLIDYDFGRMLMLPVMLMLIAASMISYGLVFQSVIRDGRPKLFEDTSITRYLRLTATIAISAAVLVGLAMKYF